MANIALQMHETPRPFPLLQPAGCIHSIAEDVVQVKIYKSVPL